MDVRGTEMWSCKRGGTTRTCIRSNHDLLGQTVATLYVVSRDPGWAAVYVVSDSGQGSWGCGDDVGAV